MTAEQLIELLSCIEPKTELGVQVGYRRTELKSMDVIGNTLYFTGNNWAPTSEEMQEFNLKGIISSIAHFAKPSDYDRGFQDGLKAVKEQK